ncbi:MAG TPA: GTPase Era [Stellaceae bacterium]|nr:GTPase Era [Stellaceae bacterium]
MSDPQPIVGPRCGYVALVGAPNAGKSTLLNLLVGTKLSIVTPKVQTTRSRVLGIALKGAAQLIFVDTPGIFAPKRRLDRAMVAAAWAGADDADIVVVLVDAARGFDDDTRTILERLKIAHRPVVLALNKIDLVRRELLLPLAEALGKACEFERVFMISSTAGDGTEDLANFLAGAVPEAPWLYPEDQLTDLPQRLLAAEITREQVYLQLHQELPYAAAVETEQWEERNDGSVKISQVIHVQRDGQKAIVLGKGGAQVKSIGAAARAELEKLLARRVHLFLFVRVTENWADDRERYRAIGLDYPE